MDSRIAREGTREARSRAMEDIWPGGKWGAPLRERRDVFRLRRGRTIDARSAGAMRLQTPESNVFWPRLRCRFSSHRKLGGRELVLDRVVHILRRSRRATAPLVSDEAAP